MVAGIRVAAVDDHPVMLRGLQAAATALSGRVSFVATAGTVGELLADLRRAGCPADVVLLDLQLRDGSRPRDNVRLLREAGTRVLVYTEGDRRTWVADALRAGALGVVLKSQEVGELLGAIELVHAGQPVLSAEMAAVLQRDAALRPQLAPREQETLRHVAEGLADKQIATVMGIAEDTVKEYLKRIRAKYADLGRPAGSRVELHRRAVEDGYVEPVDGADGPG